MDLIITTFLLTLPLFTGAALIVNICRKQAGKTRHGLTGMCHKTGGIMCCSCRSAMQKQDNL